MHGFFINYIGESDVCLEKLLLDRRFTVKKIFVSEKRVTLKLLELGKEKVVLVKNNDDFLLNMLESIEQIDFNIIFSSDIIIPDFLIEQKDFYNFHTGSLYTNRGRNPIAWTILLNEPYTFFSAYKISSKIDCGELFYEKKIAVEKDETCSSLRKKFEASIDELLNYAVRFYKKEIAGIEISDGVYRRRISENDFTIDISKDCITTIKQKIKSQDCYKGAILDYGGKKYWLKSIISECAIIAFDLIECEGNVLRIVKDNRELIVAVEENQ